MLLGDTDSVCDIDMLGVVDGAVDRVQLGETIGI